MRIGKKSISLMLSKENKNLDSKIFFLFLNPNSGGGFTPSPPTLVKSSALTAKLSLLAVPMCTFTLSTTSFHLALLALNMRVSLSDGKMLKNFLRS